jgi:hypothetical protein
MSARIARRLVSEETLRDAPAKHHFALYDEYSLPVGWTMASTPCQGGMWEPKKARLGPVQLSCSKTGFAKSGIGESLCKDHLVLLKGVHRRRVLELDGTDMSQLYRESVRKRRP